MRGRALSVSRLLAVLRDEDLLVESRAPEDLSLQGVSQDSRDLEPGDLFLAWRGTSLDAHEFLPVVREKGAAAALVEDFHDVEGLPQIRVRDGRRAAAVAAHEMMGRPGDDLRVLAITGTNGKTTTVGILHHLLREASSTAALGTLGLTGPDGVIRRLPSGLTTPGPVSLARILADLRDEGVRTVAMEASSHALEQRRLDGIRVDVACFTNLTRDHLDYHPTMEAYREAKAHLLTLLRSEESGVVVNVDDPNWAALPEIGGRLLPVTTGEGDGRLPPAGNVLPTLRARDVEVGPQGATFQLVWSERSVPVQLPLLGAFNVENALMAAGAALASGLDLDDVATRLSRVPQPLGRLELVARAPVPVLLDYAHTPDALARLLDTVRPLCSGRVLLVFGAGGDRDRAKRPEMGRVAAQGAHLPIVTSDNPRTEDPDAIIDEILGGMEGSEPHRITDRREAIAYALAEANPGDMVVLAGKGHETYQVVGRESRPFDERVIVRELLELGGRA
ncbi:MAG: UDP-N-acetylmuramoyl-L-alanyl-D-glutamate--2,6-diaminopimelate ligase [Gemmatimonadales bacterium]|nr:MAG: UDP-N-acetylmuramoyl-L-alanyl-D-glutamate--2,6-diaminopimelate ligase [Gemmatimonadales bacterium]